MMDEEQERTDEILGITRCARCGHRLEGEVDCPFCEAVRGFDGAGKERPRLPLWVLVTAMLMTFPLSLPWIVMSRRLLPWQKAVIAMAGLIWIAIVGQWFV